MQVGNLLYRRTRTIDDLGAAAPASPIVILRTLVLNVARGFVHVRVLLEMFLLVVELEIHRHLVIVKHHPGMGQVGRWRGYLRRLLKRVRTVLELLLLLLLNGTDVSPDLQLYRVWRRLKTPGGGHGLGMMT